MIDRRQQLQECGYTMLPFSPGIWQAMVAHIDHVTSPLDVSVMKDDSFRLIFKKTDRIFPDRIALIVGDWIKSNLSGILDFEDADIILMARNELRAKPSIIGHYLTEETRNIVWRYVRPGKPDIGKAHTDWQFWQIQKGTDDLPRTTLFFDELWHVWVPLLGCTSHNSLQVLPGSHRMEVPNEVVKIHLGNRPAINENWLKERECDFLCPFTWPTDIHQCILFDDKLVHRGPPNNEPDPRTSCEFTICTTRKVP